MLACEHAKQWVCAAAHLRPEDSYWPAEVVMDRTGGWAVWFADEARVGQKGRTTHVWYQRAVLPHPAREHRFASAHLFASVMNLFLAELASTPSSSSTRRGGTNRGGSLSQTTSRSCRCPPKPLS